MSKYDYTKEKPFKVLSRTSEFGRTSIEVKCPFCADVFTAYVWSISGGGKKCPSCGALHNRFGGAAPLKKNS